MFYSKPTFIHNKFILQFTEKTIQPSFIRVQEIFSSFARASLSQIYLALGPVFAV